MEYMQGCTTAHMTLPTSHIFRVTEEVIVVKINSQSITISFHLNFTLPGAGGDV